MARRRVASAAPSWVASDPQARKTSRLPSLAITPQPVRRSPGSMPRMRIGRAMPVVDTPGAGPRLDRIPFEWSGMHSTQGNAFLGHALAAQLLHVRVGNLEIGVDGLHVVVLVEDLDQLEHPLAL